MIQNLTQGQIVKGDLHCGKQTCDLKCAVCGVCRSGSLNTVAEELTKNKYDRLRQFFFNLGADHKI